MASFRVVDARLNTQVPPDVTVEASSPEGAAKSALGLDLVRSGQKEDLAARVYWSDKGQPMRMVRLYLRVQDRLNHRGA